MGRRFIVVVGFLLAVTAAAEETTLRVGVYDFHPLSCIEVDKRSEMLFPALLDHIAAQEGWQLDYLPMPMKEALAALEAGELDIVVAVPQTYEAPPHVGLSRETVVSTWGQVYTDGNGETQSILDLAGHSVAVVRDEPYNEALRNIVRRFNMDCIFVEVKTSSAVFEAIDRGWVDAGVVDRLYGIVNEPKYDVQRSPVLFSPLALRYAASGPQRQEVLATLDYHIERLREDPHSLYHRLVAQAVGQEQPARIPGWIWWGLGLAAALVLLVGAVNLVLRSQVRRKTAELSQKNAALEQQIVRRREALDALRYERNRAQSYLDVAQVILLALDTDGTVVLANRRVTDDLGWSADELRGRDWFDTCVPEEERGRTRNYFKELLSGVHGSSSEYENRVLTRGGEVRIVSWQSAILLDDAGRVNGVLSSGQDVTERKALEDQLRHSEKMQAIGQLAGGIAHDFNNQLTAMLGFAEMLRMEFDRDDQRYDWASRVVNCCRHAARLTQQLLAFARKGRHQSLPVNLHEVISEVISLLERSIDKRIRVRQVLEATRPIIVGDPSQLQNAVLNVAINARDAMPDGGDLTFATRIVELDANWCRTHTPDIEPGEYVEVVVTDTGIGMDEATLKRVFEPFFTTKADGRGTGMGLAAVYGTVRGHNGAVTLQSVVGQGTTVRLLLPLAAEAARQTGRDGQPELRRGSANILLVDDEETVRTLAASFLRRLGYTVVECADGQEAVSVFSNRGREFDLVVLDMVMPGLDGTETFLALQQIYPRVKAIIASGYGINGSIRETLAAGALGFIQKPFELGDFSQRIAEALKTE